MKRILYLVIAVMFLAAIPETTFAQSNDPFEQQTLKASGSVTKREKKISRRKGAEETTPQQTQVQAQPQQQQQVAPAPEPKKSSNKEMSISNPCDEWLDVEFVSLIGSKGAQTVKLTCKMINHDVNANLSVRRFICYDSDGNEHNDSWYRQDYKTLVDVPVKFTINIPGKISPLKTKVIPVIGFDIEDCHIELRNVPINWK